MAKFKIYASDYADLDETLSEKNIINTVEGKEYVVSELTETLLDSRTINPNTVSLLFENYDLENNTGYVAKYNENIKTAYRYVSKKDNLFGAIVDDGFLRTEVLRVKGSYTFFTDKVITDYNNISCKFNINYTKSKGTCFRDYGDSPAIGTNKTAFFAFAVGFPQLENETDNNLTLGTNELLPIEPAKERLEYPFGGETKTLEWLALNASQYCKPSFKKTSDGTEITVEWYFAVWGGWTKDGSDIRWRDGTVLSVNSISIQTFANTVDTDEVDFYYSEPIKNVERKYTLETNELFQSNSEDLEENKLSYKTFKKISESFDNDRRIIKFDLLNPLKMEIDDSEKYEKGELKERYLDVDDEFEIQDEHQKWIRDENGEICTFKVLSCNKIWDGSYHIVVTAQMEDTTID